MSVFHGRLEEDLRRYVVRHIKIKPDAPYSAEEIRKTQQAIYAMGLFSLVTVTPELTSEHPENAAGDERIPVRIALQEARPGRREWGFGVGYQRGEFSTYGSFDIAHLNLFRRLVRAELAAKAGFTVLSEADFGPLLRVRPELLIPDFPVRTLTLHAGVELDLSVEVGYWLGSVGVDVGWTWAPIKGLKVDISFELGTFDVFRDDRLAAAAAANTAMAYEDLYLLFALKETLILDLRDKPLAASKGLYLGLGATESGVAGAFGYLRLDGDVRGYVPLGSPQLVLAMHAKVSGIVQPNKDYEVPIADRVFVGGDGSVRGWRIKRAGPQVQDETCVTEAKVSDCTLPLGGNFGLAGSFELRGNVWGGLWVAGFLDFGRAWAEASDIRAAELFDPRAGMQLGIGGGIRFDTVVGRLRLDVAAHPHEWTDPEFRTSRYWKDQWREPPVWSVHFGIGESF